MITTGIPLEYFLIVSTVMFFIGVYGFLTRRNLITILMSVELILNSVNINFVAFNRYLYPNQLQGHFFSIFIIAVAACEAAVAIAIILNIYRKFSSINVENVNEMKF
jgi:NADH:ubiquinone oxidoreductase subunit K